MGLLNVSVDQLKDCSIFETFTPFVTVELHSYDEMRKYLNLYLHLPMSSLSNEQLYPCTGDTVVISEALQ